MGVNEYDLSISNNDRLEHNDFFPGLPTTSSNQGIFNNTVDGGEPYMGTFPVNVSTDVSLDQSEMEIAVNPTDKDNLVIAAQSFNDFTSTFFLDTWHTFDGGHTWTQVRMGDPAAGTDDGFAFDAATGGAVRSGPTINFDRFGNVYVGYAVSDTRQAQARSWSSEARTAARPGTAARW
jgi:hypothetical protein